MIRHRGTCEHPDCGRVWRENCEHCLRAVTERHKAETGHSVHLTITADGENGWELRHLTAKLQQGLRPLPRRRVF